MSYGDLWQHALHLEELAMKAALDEKGFVLVDGQYISLQDSNPVPADIIRFLRADFEGLAELFEPFLNLPDPEVLGMMHRELRTAAEALSSGSGSFDPSRGVVMPPNFEMASMETVGKTIFEWQGFAARQFESTFVEPWKDRVAAQFSLVATLMAAIEAEQALWTACRNNVDELAHQAINAFVSMNSFDTDQQVFWLSAAAAVLSIGSVVTSGGAAIAFTVAGGITQVAGTALDKFSGEGPAVLFDAKTPRALVEQIRQALYQLTYIVLEREHAIAEAMLVTSETLATQRDLFAFPRPALADQTSRTILTSDGLGHNV
ncbi:hypothetical protein [Actinoplanes sp. NPDC026670]|uniref:hypothetical protein n=1 Tax=Actinoplanes sp. NPDC026670 TaxID=3154700 RepID=UPI0033FA2B39